MILEALVAMIELGLPVIILSWILFDRLYERGMLDRADDHRAIKANLKQIRKAPRHVGSGAFFHNRWMKFGGGFYGVAALWTFIVIEVTDLFNLVSSFPGFESLFADGVVSLLVNALVNQVTNFVSALVWFVYWGEGDRNVLLWLIVAYLGYVMGINLVRLGAINLRKVLSFRD